MDINFASKYKRCLLMFLKFWKIHFNFKKNDLINSKIQK